GYIYMMQLIKKGPQTGEGQYLQEGGPGKLRTPARPLSAGNCTEDGNHD
ncbi:cytochrome ubiquinol oxidase subunit I, partial [Acinetobacter baumannii]|nr:cytochrome ubiquinol oxidase subunit I [Acinetobacter baumannii]